jgi:hypothetical protein
VQVRRKTSKTDSDRKNQGEHPSHKMLNAMRRKPPPYCADRNDRVPFQRASFPDVEFNLFSQRLILLQAEFACITCAVDFWDRLSRGVLWLAVGHSTQRIT